MTLTVYTDGSCMPNPSENGGWAFVVYDGAREIHNHHGRATSHTTNNRMELTGMLRALMWLGDRPATLFSDSKYVVDGLNLWCKTWQRNGWQRKDRPTKQWMPVMNADLWEVLYVARGPQHRVVWVRGHNGNSGNERADSLAEFARMGPPLRDAPQTARGES